MTEPTDEHWAAAAKVYVTKCQTVADGVCDTVQGSADSFDPVVKVKLLKAATDALRELKGAIADGPGGRLRNLDVLQGQIDTLHRQYLAAGFYGPKIGRA
jgi:hypothetical protein